MAPASTMLDWIWPLPSKSATKPKVTKISIEKKRTNIKSEQIKTQVHVILVAPEMIS
jgi:hypothetical protein